MELNIYIYINIIVYIFNKSNLLKKFYCYIENIIYLIILKRLI